MTTYTYDDLSEVLNVADNTSNYTQTYDLLGRVLTSNESISGETNTYTYDNMPHGIGFLGSVVNTTPPNLWEQNNAILTNTVTCSYKYDSYSRPQSKTETILGNPYITTFGYDNLNRVTQITYPNAPTNIFTVNQFYNNYGYLYQISSNLGNIWTCTGMNQYDEATYTQQGDGGYVNKAYDNLGYLTSSDAVEPIVGNVMNYSYQFNDQTGNLTLRGDNNGNGESFTYDNLDRLTAVTNFTNPLNNLTLTYGVGGTIGSKSDVGNYNYGAIQPHALSAITSPTAINPMQVAVIISDTILDPTFHTVASLYTLRNDK